MPNPGGAAGVGGLAALALLLPMEAGVPIPLPADLVMFTVGQQVAAGHFPLWLAVAGFEVIAVLGTTALFLVCRGPAHRIITRFGPRLGLTEARLRRAAALAVAALFFWRARRRKHADPSAWQEATCPVCIAATLLADRVPALADLTGPDPALPLRGLAVAGLAA